MLQLFLSRWHRQRSNISIISLLILTNKECKWNKYMVDVGLWSSLFILVGTCRNICSKSKFIDHRVEVTESENNYYGNFSVFVIFAPFHCETIFYCFLEMKNVITPICIQMLIRDKFSWNMTQYGKGKILVKSKF